MIQPVSNQATLDYPELDVLTAVEDSTAATNSQQTDALETSPQAQTPSQTPPQAQISPQAQTSPQETPFAQPPIVNRDALAIARYGLSALTSTVTSTVKGAVNQVIDNQRSADARTTQIGGAIDSAVTSAEHGIDGAREWLSQNGGVTGRVASAAIGFNEGAALGLYGAGKGIVQMADGAAQLANPSEWLANPQANVGRIQSTVAAVTGLGKIASLAAPASWIANPQGNAELATGLWNSTAKSFQSDPSKFVGNATATVATFFIPGGGEAEAAADVNLAGHAAAAASGTRDATALTAAANDAAAGPVTFMKNGDRFLKNAANRAEIDPNGSFDVIAHGLPNKIQIQTSNGAMLVDHRLAARLISQAPGYTGQNIRLLSCSTGATDTGFAQNLANKLGVVVHAPSDLLWAYPDGRMIVAPKAPSGGPDLGQLGTIRTFTPGRAP